MVDNGFSLRESLARMTRVGIDPATLDGLFLTHTHGDHLKGVGPLCRRYSVPLFTAPGLRLPESAGEIPLRYYLRPGTEHPFSWLTCRPFVTSHDAENSVGFSFSIAGSRVTIITDTGELSDEMAALASESRLLFLEANYDDELLASGPYPPFLRARIASELGHLSNLQAGEFLSRLKTTGSPEQIYLTHLSKNNNSPECVEAVLAASAAAEMPYTVVPRGELLWGTLGLKNRKEDV